jgi:hypothetical protein
VKVGQILKDLGYSLKGNKKTGRGPLTEDSRARFIETDRAAAEAVRDGRPLLHFESRPARGEGFDVSQASVERGDLSAGAYAANLIRLWWEKEGSALYPAAKGALVTVYDSPGGLFDLPAARGALSVLARVINGPVRVLPLPAGTHRWNHPSRELFSFLAAPSGHSGPDRTVVRARLVAPGGPASGWSVLKTVLESASPEPAGEGAGDSEGTAPAEGTLLFREADQAGASVGASGRARSRGRGKEGKDTRETKGSKGLKGPKDLKGGGEARDTRDTRDTTETRDTRDTKEPNATGEEEGGALADWGFTVDP